MNIWIRLQVSAPRDPKVLRMASELGLDPAHVFGMIIATWCAIGEQMPDGDLAQATDTVLESWAGWRGEPGRFATAYREAFIVGNRMPGWDNLQGKLIVLAKKDRARKEPQPKEVSVKFLGSSKESPAGFLGSSAPTGQDVTEQDSTTNNTTKAPPRKPRAASAKSGRKASPMASNHSHLPADLCKLLRAQFRHVKGEPTERFFEADLAPIFATPESEWEFTREEIVLAVKAGFDEAEAQDRYKPGSVNAKLYDAKTFAGNFTRYLKFVRMGTANEFGPTTWGKFLENAPSPIQRGAA